MMLLVFLIFHIRITTDNHTLSPATSLLPIRSEFELLGKYFQTHGMSRGLRFPFQIRSPLQLRPPSNSGLQGPPLQPLNIIYDPLKQS